MEDRHRETKREREREIGMEGQKKERERERETTREIKTVEEKKRMCSKINKLLTILNRLNQGKFVF